MERLYKGYKKRTFNFYQMSNGELVFLILNSKFLKGVL
jgi:hypothetical protein